MTTATTTRTATEAKQAEAARLREQGYTVTEQWHEDLGFWFLVRRPEDGMPVGVIYELRGIGRAYAERIDQDDPTVTPVTFVDDLLLKTTEGRRIR
jgi:hypothetical protein